MNPVCPKCDSERVIPITGGDPSEEKVERAARKGVDRGNSAMRRNTLEYVCQDCGTQWTRKRAERRDPTFQPNRTLTGR
jgi:DNA-directed RNA polymerase subunit RPC12/RpoP